MSWTGYRYKGFLHPFRSYRGGSRLLKGIGRGARRAIRAVPSHRQRRSCCCCPAFFLLGLAGVGLIAGFFYLGIRFLGWA
jgi:hypothetical protein